MLLAYIDETGINYKKSKGFFGDGPYIIWCTILIPENKYFHIERMFCDLAKQCLRIKDWEKSELHANVIWNEAQAGQRNLKDVKEYFEELFQLISKLSLSIIVGIQQKKANGASLPTQSKQIKLSMNACLTGLEHELSRLNETAILIADNSGTKADLALKEAVYQRTKWRYNPGNKKQTKKISKKFEFEYRSTTMLDQLHYTDSKSSLFIQLADHVSFIFNRIFTYAYLVYYPAKRRPVADINKLPISLETFQLLLYKCQISSVFFEESASDYNISSLEHEYVPSNGLNANYIKFISPYK